MLKEIVAMCMMGMGLAATAAAQEVLPVWPEGKVPFQKNSEPETTSSGYIFRITRVNAPSLTFFPAAKTEKPAPAVVVCPGGGYEILAWDLEGTELAAWLNKQGISAFVLKYRIPGQQRDAAFADAQRAVGLVRNRAKEFGIDPKRIGIMGFSAGAHLSVREMTHSDKRGYTPVDEADKTSCRPDFALIIYPAYLNKDGTSDMVSTLPVTKTLPPVFLAQAEDDPYVASGHAFDKALKAAGASYEAHFFKNGQHGFGLRKRGTESDGWGDLAKAWLAKTLR